MRIIRMLREKLSVDVHNYGNKQIAEAALVPLTVNAKKQLQIVNRIFSTF